MTEPNLPPLPDGYFWRVSKFGIDNPSPYVQLRKKRFWIFSEYVDGKMFLDSHHYSITQEVEELARQILEDEAASKRQREQVWKVMGDYGKN